MRAFDANGNVFLLSVQEETDIPVIILNSCERLGIEAKTTPLLIDKSGSDEWNDPTTGSGTTTNTSINSSPQFVKSYKFYFSKK